MLKMLAFSGIFLMLLWQFYCTGNLHMQQRQDLQDENWDPAKGVSYHDGEEPFGDGHLFLDVVAVFRGLSPCSLDVIEHACVG